MDEPTPGPAPEPTGPSDADIARQAFIQSVVSNLAMIAVVVAVNVAVAKRDAITRACRRVARSRRQEGRQARINREVAAFRRDIDEITHAAGGLLDGES